jgi:predicted RNA methylase
VSTPEQICDWFSDPPAHKRLLDDSVRCDAFRRAIQKAVKPGDIVVDLGAGTGLLSFFAVQAGARHVYAIEASSIADLAEELTRANGFSDKITLIRQNSKNVTLPERCDVLVSETMSSFCFDSENTIEFISDARDRFLKPGGKLIPEFAETILMPISSDAFGVGSVPERFYDLQFAPLRKKLFSEVSLVRAYEMPFRQLSPPAVCYQIDFRTVTANPGKTFLPFSFTDDGRLDGFLGWFQARLAEGVSIDDSPYSPRTSWWQIYFPTLEQPRVARGQKILFELELLSTKDEPRWSYSTRLLQE